MVRLVAVAVAVAVVAASCSSPTEQDTTPDTDVPVVTEATSADRSVPAADRISVSQGFGGSMDLRGFSGGLNIVNSSDSTIAAAELTVEFLRNGATVHVAELVASSASEVFLTPGSNWFSFWTRRGRTVDELRLRSPEVEYAELPGTFETTIDVEPLPDGSVVSGAVVSAWPSDLSNAIVHVVWFNSFGEPTLGLLGLVAGLASGESASFEIDTSELVDESWTYRVKIVELGPLVPVST